MSCTCMHTHAHACCVQTSGDVVVLSNALFVVSAILPMVPSYVGGHLHDIFTIFCELATIRTTNRLGKKLSNFGLLDKSSYNRTSLRIECGRNVIIFPLW